MTGRDGRISLAHGSGGRLTHQLIREVFGSRLSNPALDLYGDSAVVELGGGAPGTAPGDVAGGATGSAPAGSVGGAPDRDCGGQAGIRLAMTTDAFVVSPLFFPGGDIGRLAVCGTVNDLAMAGAVPRYLSCAVVLEEGLAEDQLCRIVDSMRGAADEAGVLVVTGDTKVVERGKGDGLYITTAGIGELRQPAPTGLAAAAAGDAILASGPLGDHGAVIVALRFAIQTGSGLRSDCAPLGGLVGALYQAGVVPCSMRDPTRGGAAGVLAEMAAASGLGVDIDENALPVRPEVRAVCDLLGLEPLHLANEGRMLAVVAAGDAERALAALRAHPLGREAAIIGRLRGEYPGQVVLRTRYGGQRLIDMPLSEPVPRIC